ncbi:unnamed protein product [Litomosoides sigmodontis]|uniref:Low-density lipoprotein receptor domain class A n=1 Tax=Litomosoides sigmodontis TaxID=42156 RepID=A0A3P6TF95_LITSI|nr:unnamed protein product [Litomosoides sigmodontis]
MTQSPLSLSLSLVLLLSTTPSSAAVEFAERRRILPTIFLILPSLCFDTAATATGQQQSSVSATRTNDRMSAVATDTSKVLVKSGNGNSIMHQHHHCPASTFRCGDGSCIPQDWINDGEVDCSDMSDEQIRSTTTKGFSESAADHHPITIDEAVDDPFDRPSVTFPSTEHRKKSPSSLNRPYRCSDATQARVNQCSTGLTDWMRNLDQVDLANSSVINDEAR